MKVVLIQYNAGNERSVLFALKRLGVEAVVSNDPDVVRSADKVIFPGVGEARSAMASLRESRLDQVIPTLTQPVLGICLGMQILCRWSEENETPCLGVFPQRVVRLRTDKKIPHIGWNGLVSFSGPLFESVSATPYFYFVHSYAVEIGESTCATCEYGEPFSAAIQHENFYAVQFHPEKSAVQGEKVLRNFLKL